MWVIPEDEANRQLLVGFADHHAVEYRQIGIGDPAGGWPKVLDVFESEYVPLLRNFQSANVIMLIDFDDKVEDRRRRFLDKSPEDLSSRVFVIGSQDEPEVLKQELGIPLGRIGTELAQECHTGDFRLWRNAHLEHNEAELQRLIDAIKPILFQFS